MFEITINANKAWAEKRETLTRAGKNYDAQKISLDFSDEWENLGKIAVFRAMKLQMDVPVTGEIVDIPTAVLDQAGVELFLGLYGVSSDGTVVIPTIWADLGLIQPAPDPWGADNIDSPTPGLFAQLETLTRAAQSAAAAAASGVYAGSVDFSINADGHLIMSATEEGETTTTDLGAVTAYAAAVAGGYSGTYAEFQSLLTANAQVLDGVQDAIEAVAAVQDTAEAAQSAAEAAQDAAESAQSASSSAQTAAQNAATTAQQVASGKQNKHKTATVTLASGQRSWPNLSATGVTASNLVFWGPAPGDLEAASEALVELTAQGSGKVSFSAASNTSKAITINLAIFD